MTLDASSLYVCMKRMGVFATGRPLHRDLDTLLLAGNNPVVSHQGWSKSPLPSSNPRKAIAEAQAQGTKLIVIDPRLTETARKADDKADARMAQAAAYRFMAAMAGDRPGFEEACRALFAGDAPKFLDQTETWPVDIRDYATRLATPAFG